VQVTALVPMHVPAWQLSTWVQRSPSLHWVPFGFSGPNPHTPVAWSQVPGSWHSSVAAQITGLVPVHVPAWQLSTWVQRSPSLHWVPFGFSGPTPHTPVAWSQVPGSWHSSVAVQVTGLVPVHVPAWQLSTWVQGLPSLHWVPFGFSGPNPHTPVAWSQVPGSWHSSVAVQITGLVPVHVPAWQPSTWVQRSPSLQGVPLGFSGAFSQFPEVGSQVPGSWQASGAAQITGLPPAQAPDWQLSTWVQRSPSLQTFPSGTAG
jgi:hypothetical protein